MKDRISCYQMVSINEYCCFQQGSLKDTKRPSPVGIMNRGLSEVACSQNYRYFHTSLHVVVTRSVDVTLPTSMLFVSSVPGLHQFGRTLWLADVEKTVQCSLDTALFSLCIGGM